MALHGHKDVQAEAQQHAGQHPGGKGDRNPPDRPFEESRNPATIPNTAATTNAPTASRNGTPAALPISIAAPGVDQAVTTGAR